jgi:hypothetical protein
MDADSSPLQKSQLLPGFQVTQVHLQVGRKLQHLDSLFLI